MEDKAARVGDLRLIGRAFGVDLELEQASGDVEGA